jgi:SNF2 family DNA or RNA helicase
LPPDSAKIRKLLELLEEINSRENDEGEPAGEKTIVFSQFTTMLDLIQPFLKEAGIKFVRCELPLHLLTTSPTNVCHQDDGSMSKEKREVSLDQIKTNDRVKVILISFKAGSTGK